MSHLIVTPALLHAAASDQHRIASRGARRRPRGMVDHTLGGRRAGRSIHGSCRLFGAHARDYQELCSRAADFHQRFVQTLSRGAASYAGTAAAPADRQRRKPGTRKWTQRRRRRSGRSRTSRGGGQARTALTEVDPRRARFGVPTRGDRCWPQRSATPRAAPVTAIPTTIFRYACNPWVHHIAESSPVDVDIAPPTPPRHHAATRSVSCPIWATTGCSWRRWGTSLPS